MKTSNKKRTRDFFEAAREILGDEKVDRAVKRGMKYQEKVQANLEHIGAVEGWTYTSRPTDYKHADTLYPSGEVMRCELCGHKLKSSYRIVNHEKQLFMNVGSECVKLFTGRKPEDIEFEEYSAIIIEWCEKLDTIEDQEIVFRLRSKKNVLNLKKFSKAYKIQSMRELLESKRFLETKNKMESEK